MFKKILLINISIILLSCPLYANEIHGLSAPDLSLWWALPFVGILLSLAVWPLIAPQFWHPHFGKISLCWALLVAIPMLIFHGLQVTAYEISHAILVEYIPFIVVITALFTISGGIKISCDWSGTPTVNTLLLLIATIMASIIGTTGAAMLFIRPLLMMNSWRLKKTHIVVFFIFLVCNIGGSLTALGDPPLFLGFLAGVDFFWPMFNLIKPFLVVSLPLLLIFFILDCYFCYNNRKKPPKINGKKTITIRGGFNFGLLGIVIAAIIISGNWNPGISLTIFHIDIPLQNILREVVLIGATLASMKFTLRKYREYNNFNWGPVIEVAKIFAAIFIAAVPIIAILKTGNNGALGFIVNLVNVDGKPVNDLYFYLTGALSAVLDNAPTYLVFFNMAGGDATILMGKEAITLTAISCGAVFMGALTYIGNAPNFMVKSIAETQGIPMPSFFGYLGWSIGILLPLFIIVSWLYF